MRSRSRRPIRPLRSPPSTRGWVPRNLNPSPITPVLRTKKKRCRPKTLITPANTKKTPTFSPPPAAGGGPPPPPPPPPPAGGGPPPRGGGGGGRRPKGTRGKKFAWFFPFCRRN